MSVELDSFNFLYHFPLIYFVRFLIIQIIDATFAIFIINQCIFFIHKNAVSVFESITLSRTAFVSVSFSLPLRKHWTSCLFCLINNIPHSLVQKKIRRKIPYDVSAIGFVHKMATKAFSASIHSHHDRWTNLSHLFYCEYVWT